MILPITTYGHPILRQKTIEAVDTQENRQLVNNMLETLANIPTGVGLAAPQVNSDKSIFISRVGSNIMVHINPVIIKRRGTQPVSNEGCLSIPGIFEEVINRDDNIEIISYDESFNRRRIKLSKFDSRIFQHELEHLNGILFIDHVTKEGREKIVDQLSEIERGKIQTHYDMIFADGTIFNSPEL